MNDPLQDDRLSAYLDGELTDQQRAELEAEMAADPARQQVVEELRSLSATLRALPRQTLGDDFRDQVLRKAERAMLAAPGEREPSATLPTDAIATGAIQADPRSTSTDRTARELADRTVVPIGYSRRGWVWAALAVAAALLIMIRVNRQEQFGLEVARHEPLPASADKTPAPSSEPAIVADGEEAVESAKEGGEGFALKTGPAVDEVDGARSKLGTVAKSGAKSAAESAARSSLESLDSDAESGLAFRSDQTGEARWELAAKAGKRADADKIIPDATSRVMVVHVDMAPKAVEKNRFNTVLLSHGIQCPAEEKYGVYPTLAGAEPERKSKDGLEDANKLPPTPYRSRSGESYGSAKRRMARSSGGQATNEDVLFVCADYRQVAGALAQLQEESNDFPAVEIDPAPTVQSQQSLARFTRGRVTNSLAADNYVNRRQSGMQQQVGRSGEQARTVPPDGATLGGQTGAGAPNREFEPSQVAQSVPQESSTQSKEHLKQTIPQEPVAEAPQSPAQPQSKSGIETEADRLKRNRGQVGSPPEKQLLRFFADMPTDFDGQEAVARAERVAPTKRPVAEQLIQQRRLENRSQQSLKRQLAGQQQESLGILSNEPRDRTNASAQKREQSEHGSKRDAQARPLQEQADSQRVPSAKPTPEAPSTAPADSLADEPVQVLFVLNVVPSPPADEKPTSPVAAPHANEPESKD